MDYDNYEQSYQNLTFSQFGPKDYGQLPVWDARHLGSTVDLSFQYADSREVIPIDIPALLQLQFDRGIRSSSPPFNPGMYTPLSGPYPFGSEQQPVPPQVPANMSQQDMIGGLPDTSFRRWKEHHGRLRQHEHHDSFNNAPMYVPPQPFMESSIFRGRSARDAQHIHPTSASQAHLQPIRSPGPGSTYFPRPSRSLFSGFYDLHLRAPGARVVVDGVDVTDRLNSTSAGTRAKENTNIEPHHHHDGPRNVLNTRIARYLPGQGTRVIRDGRIFRDSNGRRRVVFTDIKLLDDFHQGHHTHDHYLHLLNESRTNRLVSRPTPLHAPYTFGPSILPDPFHEIAVDQKGMVVIRKIEGALPMDRRYPNCLCGRPMNNEEIDSGWRLCLNCHMKVRDERNLVDARGRPCLREWLADLFPNAKSCEEYNVPSNKSSWETEEGRERLILTRKGRVPYLEDRGEGARSDQYHARHSHCHGGKGQDTAEAGPSIQVCLKRE